MIDETYFRIHILSRFGHTCSRAQPLACPRSKELNSVYCLFTFYLLLIVKNMKGTSWIACVVSGISPFQNNNNKIILKITNKQKTTTPKTKQTTTKLTTHTHTHTHMPVKIHLGCDISISTRGKGVTLKGDTSPVLITWDQNSNL